MKGEGEGGLNKGPSFGITVDETEGVLTVDLEQMGDTH